MQSKQDKIREFEKNPRPQGGIFGLPFNFDDSETIVLPVPWQATIASERGCDKSPQAIFDASHHICYTDDFHERSWRQGIYMLPVDSGLQLEGATTRKMVAKQLESPAHSKNENTLQEINRNCQKMIETVKRRTRSFLAEDKRVATLGGDASTSLGYIMSLAESVANFGVLQIDAHPNLCYCYQNIRFSHASTSYNILEIPNVSSLVQVGLIEVRQEEDAELQEQAERIHPFKNRDIFKKMAAGCTWHSICEDISAKLPKDIFLHLDVDALLPCYFPQAALRVQGGLEYEQCFYLMEHLVNSGKRIVGISLVGVGIDSASEWDALMGARTLFRFLNVMAQSHSTSIAD